VIKRGKPSDPAFIAFDRVSDPPSNVISVVTRETIVFDPTKVHEQDRFRVAHVCLRGGEARLISDWQRLELVAAVREELLRSVVPALSRASVEAADLHCLRSLFVPWH
jgi:hypothetical protein